MFPVVALLALFLANVSAQYGKPLPPSLKKYFMKLTLEYNPYLGWHEDIEEEAYQAAISPKLFAVCLADLKLREEGLFLKSDNSTIEWKIYKLIRNFKKIRHQPNCGQKLIIPQIENLPKFSKYGCNVVLEPTRDGNLLTVACLFYKNYGERLPQTLKPFFMKLNERWNTLMTWSEEIEEEARLYSAGYKTTRATVRIRSQSPFSSKDHSTLQQKIRVGFPNLDSMGPRLRRLPQGTKYGCGGYFKYAPGGNLLTVACLYYQNYGDQLPRSMKAFFVKLNEQYNTKLEWDEGVRKEALLRTEGKSRATSASVSVTAEWPFKKSDNSSLEVKVLATFANFDSMKHRLQRLGEGTNYGCDGTYKRGYDADLMSVACLYYERK